MSVSTTDDAPSADFSRLTPRIDAALAQYAEFGDGCPPTLAEAIRYALLAPGKRLRPQLVLMAAEACGGSVDAAMPTACAVEMVHAYSLVHDDLPAMDDDDLRRGRPTCHKAFGEAVAILVGDALLARAFEVLADGVRPAAAAARCCAVLGRAAGATLLVGGQADDLAMADWEPGERPVSEAQLHSIHARKTGALFVAALEMGAITAEASAEQIAVLSEFGRRLGLAFQITDDLLDVAGSVATAGKRVAKDADRGKMTFPALLGVDESRRQAAKLTDEACAMIEIFGRRGEPLQALARFVCSRDR